MNTERICPSCRKPLPPESGRDLCPECLMKAGFESTASQLSGAHRFVAPTVEELAKVFPQLEILQLLGQGGMGAVYKARQPGLDRFVALKILPPEATADPGFAERFAREARALARLNHPNIVSVYDFGTTQGLHHFVMEHVEGVNLRQLVRAGRCSPREALEIVPQICDALQFAHDEGVVHRDIKPENIMIDKKGRVKITDFGLAKLLGRDAAELQLTGVKEVMGTPNYMAPEQREQPQAVDHRADIYSLGVVFYELLTGELPIGKFDPPSRKVHVDVRLDEVVLHTLEKEPERRYQHASQVKTDLVTIAQTQSASQPFRADSAEDSNLEAALRQVKGPATGLLVTAILNWVGISLIGSVMASVAAVKGDTAFGRPSVWIAVAVLVLSSVMLVASLKMRRLQAYWLAVAGSVLAMVITPGNLVGLPLGIWSLVVLTQRQVRGMFGKEHPLPRTASAPTGPTGGAAWKVALVIIASLMLLAAIVIGGAFLASVTLPALSRARAKATQMKGAAEKEMPIVAEFGPQTEIVLNDIDEKRGAEALDLDSGRILDLPNDLEKQSEAQRQDWIQQQGVDLFLDRVDHATARWGLLSAVGNELKLAPTSDDEWVHDQLADPPPLALKAVLDETIRRGNWTVYVLSTNTQPPFTFRFATANGSKGLLQITGLGVKPNYAKMRFKLLSQEP